MQNYLYIICVFQIIAIPLRQQVKITDYLLRLLPYPFGICLHTYIKRKHASKHKQSDNKQIYKPTNKGG